jgi:hypothetical protein
LQINLIFCKAKNYCAPGEITYACGFAALNIGSVIPTKTTVAKVENRATLKISQKLVLRPFRRPECPPAD